MNIKSLFAGLNQIGQNNASLNPSVRFSGKNDGFKYQNTQEYLQDTFMNSSSGDKTSKLLRIDILKLIKELLEEAKTKSTDKDDDNNKTLISKEDVLQYFKNPQNKLDVDALLGCFQTIGLLEYVSKSAFFLKPRAEEFLNKNN